jgi:hypothetical protein
MREPLYRLGGELCPPHLVNPDDHRSKTYLWKGPRFWPQLQPSKFQFFRHRWRELYGTYSCHRRRQGSFAAACRGSATVLPVARLAPSRMTFISFYFLSYLKRYGMLTKERVCRARS